MRRAPTASVTARRHRRGTVFAYAIAYMTLSLLLLGLAGSMLHVLLRSADTNRRLLSDLSALRGAERLLRRDAEAAASVDLQAERATVTTSAGTAVWTIDRATLNRELLSNGQRIELQTIRFRRGTALSFSQKTDQLFALGIDTLPPGTPVPPRDVTTTSNTPSQSVEILLRRPRPADSDTPTAETTSP